MPDRLFKRSPRLTLAEPGLNAGNPSQNPQLYACVCVYLSTQAPVYLSPTDPPTTCLPAACPPTWLDGQVAGQRSVIYLYLAIYLHTEQSVCPSSQLSVLTLYTCLSSYLFAYLCISLSMFRCIQLFISLTFYKLSIHPWLCYLSIYWTIYLAISPSIYLPTDPPTCQPGQLASWLAVFVLSMHDILLALSVRPSFYFLHACRTIYLSDLPIFLYIQLSICVASLLAGQLASQLATLHIHIYSCIYIYRLPYIDMCNWIP